jgi:phosphoserine phosphatase
MSANSDFEIVATLIAGGGNKLSAPFLKETAGLIERIGGHPIRIEELAENTAADIFCRGITAEKLQISLTANARTHPVDVLIQPAATRRKKLLVADMESTMIQQEMVDELAAELGFGEQVAAITRRSMNGEVDFAASLRERVALLKGQPESLLDEVAKKIDDMPGAAALLATMKKNGAVSWLVTGGFMHFAKPVVKRLGFNRVFANELIIRGGILTGELVEPILDGDSKKVLLEKACAELEITMAEAVAVGDGANDIAMLSTCNAGGGLGVAYHAKPAVRAAVPQQINHSDLTALLYAQGLTSSFRM